MFGINKDGNYISVVVDGDGVEGNMGVTAYEQAQIIKQLGAVNAINFDGGYSSAFWYDGSIITYGEEQHIERLVFLLD